jgi:hypothetical protein
MSSSSSHSDTESIQEQQNENSFLSIVGPYSTPLVYIFAISVLLFQFQATIILIVLLCATMFAYQKIISRQEENNRNWAKKNPEEAKKNSFEEKVKEALEKVKNEESGK